MLLLLLQSSGGPAPVTYAEVRAVNVALRPAYVVNVRLGEHSA